MRLTRVKVSAFRCYGGEVDVEISDLTALIGRNDAGKSTLLDALDIFFNEDKKIDAGDGNAFGDLSKVCITCEFDDVPKSIVIDANFETNLAGEHLLNSRNRLEIRKTYNCALASPKLVGVDAIALHPTTPRVDDLLALKISELKKRADDLGVSLDGVSKTVKAAIRARIWGAVPDLQLAQTPVRLAGSESGDDIWKQLQKRLPVYALFKADRASTDQDEEAQDPMKAAVKEAIKEQEEELQRITAFVQEQVCKIAQETVTKLHEIDPTLANELRPALSPPRWDSVFKLSLTGDNTIPINKRGSGVRRLLLLSFFRAKAERSASGDMSRRIIYAIEEPETSQHPHNQRLLMKAFLELSASGTCQVLLTTHTPNLVRMLPVDVIRYVHNDENTGERRVSAPSSDADALLRVISKSLGVLPDHDVRLFIGVEGPNDIAFLCALATALRSAGMDIPDLVRHELDGTVVFVPLGGSTLNLWVSRLKSLNRPEFYLCDRDIPPPSSAKYQKFVDEVNGRGETCSARSTSKRELENYLHPTAIEACSLALHAQSVRINFGDFDDVPALAAECLHAASAGPTPWSGLDDDAKGKKAGKAKRWLNSRAAAEMTPQLLEDRDPNGEVLGWFAEIDAILRSS